MKGTEKIREKKKIRKNIHKIQEREERISDEDRRQM